MEISHKKITFHNHFGITLTAEQYTPKEYEGKLAASRGLRPVRSRQGAGQRALRQSHGRTWVSHHCL